jgi:GTPase KRas protein
VVLVFDTAGREEHMSLKDSDIRAGNGFVLVFSVTARSTFQEIAIFRDRILRVKDKEVFPMVLVGNKIDLENEREVSHAEGSELARAYSIAFFETSAKLGQNIDAPFFELIRWIKKEPKQVGKKGQKKSLTCKLM